MMYPIGARVQLNAEWHAHTEGKGQGPWRYGTEATVVGHQKKEWLQITRFAADETPECLILCLRGGDTRTAFNPRFVELLPNANW